MDFSKWINKVLSFKFIVAYGIISLIVLYSWIGLEYELDGKVISQYSDNVFYFILCYLLTDKILNIINYMKK